MPPALVERLPPIAQEPRAPKIKRTEEAGLQGRLLHDLERRTGADGHRGRGRVELLDPAQALERQRDLAVGGTCTAAQAREAALRHDTDARGVAQAERGRDLVGMSRQHEGQRTAFRQPAPVVAIARRHVVAREHPAFAERTLQLGHKVDHRHVTSAVAGASSSGCAGMAQAQVSCLPGGRMHLSEGPIDLVIRAWGHPRDVAAAYERAACAFEGLLRELVAEIDLLRRRLGERCPVPSGPVARRMVESVWPFREVYITPMAAVAGAVSDHVLLAMTGRIPLERAFVNDGGDIALYLGPGQRMVVGMVGEVADPRLDGAIEIRAAERVRGVATSGWAGRSFSLGIADAVTVLATTAAAADAAATVIGNAVNVDHPAILRRPARDLDPDSDLGQLRVTVGVGSLEDAAVVAALDAGAVEADRLRGLGLIEAAALRLRGRTRLVGTVAVTHSQSGAGSAHGCPSPPAAP